MLDSFVGPLLGFLLAAALWLALALLRPSRRGRGPGDDSQED
jgi:hypothetical protein